MEESIANNSNEGFSDEQLLPIAHIAEIQFCERNFYYRMAESADDANEHVLKGRFDDEKRMRRMNIKRESGMQTRNVVVISRALGIIGAIDVFEEVDGKSHIVEFKKGILREHVNDDVQLCAQAMAWEDMTGGQMPFGYVYYHESHRRRQVWFTEDLRDKVVQTIERARAILDSGEIPAPVNDERCVGCSLREKCMPDEVSFLNSIQKDSKSADAKIARPTPTSHLGRVLYVQDPGQYVRKDGRCLKVTKEKEVIREIPIEMVDEVVSGTAVQWSSSALQFLFSEGIPLAFITRYGRHAGAIQPAFSKNSLLRIKQFEFRNSERRYELARAFSIGKLCNMRVLMLRHDRGLDGDNTGALQAKGQITFALKKLKAVNTRDEILGYEGIGSRFYFERYSTWIRSPFQFSGRVRRPPTDPINAMLSLGYSLLTSAVQSAIQLVGMDPFVGFLHEAVYGRPALALDIMEEFRPIIVDSVVLRAANQGVLTPHDFETNGQGIILTDSGRKSFYQLFENRMKEEMIHPLFGYHLTYRRLIELQVRFVAKVVTGEIAEYVPLKVR
jgi:CRISP-associated protein Cas1